MNDVAKTDELPSSREAYEPPRLDELGNLDELTTQTHGGSITDTGTTG